MKCCRDLKSNTWEKYSSAQTLQKKKNDSLFFFKAFTLPRIGETKYTTSSILTRYYNGRLYHLCIFTHAYSKGPHAHKALQGVSSVSRIPSKATTNYTLIALVKIGETFETFSFDFFPPPKLSMKSAFIKVQNTFQHLTYEVVNDDDTPYWGGNQQQKKPAGLLQSRHFKLMKQGLQIAHLYYRDHRELRKKMKWQNTQLAKYILFIFWEKSIW